MPNVFCNLQCTHSHRHWISPFFLISRSCCHSKAIHVCQCQKHTHTDSHTMNEVDEVPENEEVRIRFHCIQCMANGSCFTNETVQKHFAMISDILPDTSLHIFHSLQVKIHDKRIQRDMQSSHHRAQHRQRHIPAATESCSESWFSHTATAHCDVGKMETEKKNAMHWPCGLMVGLSQSVRRADKYKVHREGLLSAKFVTEKRFSS